MQRVESYRLRGVVDTAAADRRDARRAARRQALAEQTAALRDARTAGVRVVPDAPAREASLLRQVKRTGALPMAPASRAEQRLLAPGMYRLPDGGKLAIGHEACVADMAARRVKRADRLVEYAAPRRRGQR